MLAKIKEILLSLHCSMFALEEKTVTSWEFYFVRHDLDQNRMTRVKTINVKVFIPSPDQSMLGSASAVIHPTASDEEIHTVLKNLVYQASLVKNPFYTLPDKPVDCGEPSSVDIEGISGQFLKAIRSVREAETEQINSYEIFIREIRVHFENSNGVEYDIAYPSSMVEVIINARNESKEIELYRNYCSGVCDGEKLIRDVEKALTFGKDRLSACATPSLGKSDVLFSAEDAVAIYRYFIDRMNAGLQYRKLSDWKPGTPVAEYTTGDRISVFAASSLSNSSESYPVDAEGSLIRDRYLIRNGVAESTWGTRQMSEYLGEKDSSLVSNFIVSGGESDADTLHGGDYLELVEFSDFQVDPVEGNLLGEIRLGYWHHDGKREIITGGSISGTMPDVIPSMRFSKEQEQYDTCVIPKETRLYNLNLTGVR